jgi:acetoin utilization deacetylase AcuC-like enzyme
MLRTVAMVTLFRHDAMLLHEQGPGHLESPERLRAIVGLLEARPVAGTAWRSPEPVHRALLERVHAPAYVESVERLRGKRARLDPDTALSAGSVHAALLSAGAAVGTVAEVMGSGSPRAFAFVRPPGHHAERSRGMGFCVFNNVAIAVAHARAELGCERVLVVDWDVHHGNGTQNAFWNRRDVLVFNTHRYPFYPGTGAADETGEGEGLGFTVNVPLPVGCGDADYGAAFTQVLEPVAHAFRPDLVVVSAGYDAHADDPLGGMELTEDGFAALCGLVVRIAEAHAAGRVAAVLEGGYDVAALARSVRACVGVLTGSSPPPLSSDPSPRAADAIRLARSVQSRFWPV